MVVFLGFVFLVIAAAVFVMLVQAAKEFYAIHIARRLNRSIDLRERFGTSAVITGATDGIGKGYAFALASKHVNLILVARNEEKVKNVISDIKAKYPKITATYILHDFAKQSPNDVTKFHDAFQPYSKDIGILINNVGIVSDFPNQKFIDAMTGSTQDMMNVNIQSQLLMTQTVLPLMLHRSCGIIVNVSSLAGIHPGFGNIVYSATKSFNDFFSRGLRQELRGTGIQVQTVYPGRIATRTTPSHLRRMPNWLVPNPMDYAANCVETMGHLSETYGTLNHRCQAMIIYSMKLIPTMVMDCVLGWIRERRGAGWLGPGKKE